MALTKAPEELLDKSLTSALTITTADNTTQLTLTSTDADASVGPRLDLNRDSSSPAADDYLGVIRWLGDDDAGNSLSYAHMSTYIEDPADGGEDGKFEIDTRVAGTMRSRMLMTSTETAFNNEQVALDFRVESDNFSHLFFVDASEDGVGIGDGGTQAGGLKIQSATSTTNDIDVKLYLNARTTGTPTTGFGPGIVFAGDRNSDNATQQMARINAIAEVNSGTTLSSGLQFMTATAGTNSEKLRITNTGPLLHGTTSVPTGVLLGNQLVSSSATGAEIIAMRADTSVAAGDMCGAFLIGNTDSSGTEDHFAGMYAKSSTTNGTMDLHFAAGRSNYETDTPNLTISKDGYVTMPFQPAFTVRPSSTQSNIATGSDVTVAFGTEIFDQNDDFASNTFTAPVTGRYWLGVTLRIDNIDKDASYYRLQIATSNRTHYPLIKAGSAFGASDPAYVTLQGFCLADMDASDTVTVQIHQVGGTAQADIITESQFQGYLVA